VPESYELVGLCVTSETGLEEYYHYVVVVSVHGPAGQALSRVIGPILIFLNINGVRGTMYVDDGRTLARSKAKADADYELTLKIFKKAGFTIAEEKSDKLGSAAQIKEYLGFKINTLSMTVHVPTAKLDRTKSILKGFIGSKVYKVREVASVVGKLVSLEAALGKAVLVGTRLATIAIVAATHIAEAAMRRGNPWEKRIIFSTEAMEALSEVLARLDEWNGYPIRCLHSRITLSSVLPWEATASLDGKISAPRLHDRRAVMASDASDFAVASYSIEGLPEFSFLDKLTFKERGESSSHRELLAISRTLGFMKKSGR
jgi:hypothetical protein